MYLPRVPILIIATFASTATEAFVTQKLRFLVILGKFWDLRQGNDENPARETEPDIRAVAWFVQSSIDGIVWLRCREI